MEAGEVRSDQRERDNVSWEFRAGEHGFQLEGEGSFAKEVTSEPRLDGQVGFRTVWTWGEGAVGFTFRESSWLCREATDSKERGRSEKRTPAKLQSVVNVPLH